MPGSSSPHERRKEAQLRTCLEQDVQAVGITNGLERFRFMHQSLPEVAWQEIDLSVALLGKRLRAPVLISPMTGGCRLGGEINRNLAIAARRLGLGMGVGSQRAALADPALAPTFQVRGHAPDILLLGNVGAAQLNAGFGVEECRRAVEMIGADALCFHLNGLQEVFQEGGDCDLRGLADRMAAIIGQLGVPVAAKEVGWGLSREAARRLLSAGVSALDVAGGGGTSWYLVERLAGGVPHREAVRSPFASWGIPTADSLRQVLSEAAGVPVVASGGIRDGVDAAKALALGATAVGIALPLLRPATESPEAVVAVLERFIFELRTAMFCVGAADLASLRGTPHLVGPE